MGFEVPLWRTIAVFRAASLAYAVYQVVGAHRLLAHPLGAAAVLVVMAGWTVFTVWAYGRGRGRMDERVLAAADAVVAFACLASTALVVEPVYLRHAPPLTSTWFAGAALAAAVVGGRRWALCVALGHGVVDIAMRVSLGLEITAAVPRGVVLLLLAGYSMGYLAHYALQAERRLAEAVEIEARTAERERLARSIHDSVLQVLAMVRRRGEELGGEAGELGRLAGEQEVRLRTLVGSGPSAARGEGAGGGGRPPVTSGSSRPTPSSPSPSSSPRGGPSPAADLHMALAELASSRVTFAGPADPVRMPAHAVSEIRAAVEAALANVDRHCPEGTRVWLLLEDEGGEVAVTVRDDGPGMPADRPEEAREQGRLGMSQSIRGRIRDLGGTTEVITAPGEGTEIEMRIPVRGQE
ncbi:MacS family sensor histidine kinase [Nocardiopsis suaedae]|uniref:DUF5931 domain-containing protein n=1 Tax=Nocardiopsis suaedae TaxID=3018444 RepID=A0ABT4TPH1_9ACTN|nr:DUF5931 domain-containing protein [Nocardiopsis suaedae]MDA2806580.1 DUF5931 domain-containing protein [Nocardiopsis suaedae]